MKDKSVTPFRRVELIVSNGVLSSRPRVISSVVSFWPVMFLSFLVPSVGAKSLRTLGNLFAVRTVTRFFGLFEIQRHKYTVFLDIYVD